MNEVGVLLQAGIWLALYAVARNRLSAAAQPFRLFWAEQGEALLAAPNLPPAVRERVEQQLRDVFDPSTSWSFVLALPFAVAAMLKDAIAGRRRLAPAVPQELLPAFGKFSRWGLFLGLCNSPLAFALFLVEFGLFALLFVPALDLLERMASVRRNDFRGFHDGHSRHA